MKTSNKFRLLTGLLVTAGTLSACNGGSTTSSGGISATAAPITATASKSLFAASSCLTGSFATTGSIWYVNDTLTLTNTCSSSQDLSTQSVSLTSQDNNGAGIAVGELENGWYPATQASYKVTFTAGSGNQQVGTITASNNKPTLPANSSITFTGGFNINGIAYNSALASSSFAINGSSQPTATGILNVVVDTTTAGCSGTTVCNGLTVNVNDASGTSVANFTVPAANLGATYQVPVQKLTAGSSYSVSATPITNTTVSYTPATATISATESKTITVKYTPSGVVGNATVKLSTYVKTYTSPLQVKIINTALESSPVVNTYSVTQGGSFATGDLPISDSKHVYKVVMTTGIADPAKGSYYYESGLPILTITKGSPATLDIPMAQVATSKLKNVTLAISGLESGDTAATSFSDSSNKYSYVNVTGATNGSVVYKVESGLLFGASTKANGSNTYTTNPIVNTTTINAAKTFKAAFVKAVTPPSGATVAGWPSYLAMGTITNIGYFTSPNLENGLDHPTDAIFKYAGSNGAGDQGFILFPQTTSRTILEAEYYSEATKHLSKPVLVEYTLQLSGGGTEMPDLQPNVMAYHFINLATDAAYLEANGTNSKAYSTYGSIILNPDALGFIQQQGMDGTNPNSSVDLTKASYPVNQEIAKAICYLTNQVSYSWTFSNTGKTINYTGTPIQVAQGITDQANGAWVMSDNDYYKNWSTTVAPAWYAQCESNPTNPQKISIPTFTNDFAGWVQANNWLIKQFGPHVTFGWHENVSMLPAGSRWIHQYNSHAADTVNNIQTNVSTPTVNTLNRFKIFTGTYKPDFIVFDRYEVDDTNNLSFFYNDSDWDNMLTMVGQVSRSYNNLPVMLWQMPGGHLQVTNDIDTRNSHGGTLGSYFFGDSNLNMGASCANSNLQSYWCELNNITSADYTFNGSVYGYLMMNGYNWSKDNGKLALAASNNVFSILWGGGTGPTTGINHIAQGDNDNGWLANKVINYYKNPVYFK